MKETVYVFGHQNPDTDSICSAISYSYLKNQIDSRYHYEAVGLKDVNKETQYVLNYFDLNAPMIVQSLKPQVSDINLSNYAFVKETDSIKKTLEVLTSQIGRSLSVVDKNNRLIGVVSISDIVPRILSMGDKRILKDSKTPFRNVIEDLSLTEIVDFYDSDGSGEIKGNVYVSTDLIDEKEALKVTKDDIVICHKSEWQTYIHYAGGIIVGALDDAESIEKLKKDCIDYTNKMDPKEFKGSVYCSYKTVFELIKALAQSTPISSIVIKEGLQYFVTYETIDDVKENMLSSRFRRFPVVDEDGQIKGMISRSDLVAINKKKAILVDHNERGQSIEGIEDIDILEIIDHHRVADVSTIAPLYFRVEPVGCTCTIVARLFEENGITIPKQIAGLMVSAIISDTLLFNSPTCTELDKKTAEKLAKIAEVDLRYYGMKMITEGSDLEDQSPNQILNNDRKKFMFGKYKVTISQVNTGDFDGFFKIFEDTREEMMRICEQDGYNLFVLLVTDVVVGGTEVVAVGDSKWIVDSAYNMKPTDVSLFLPGVFSRKKQIVPTLMNAAQL